MKTAEPCQTSSVTKALQNWFSTHARKLPWRVDNPDSYYIWLSESMGQQTRLSVVVQYFEKFIKRWPRLSDLAAATEEEILAQWAGLGYYARARNLHRCAQIVVQEYGGKLPADEATLRHLPGLGVYSAAAIAAIAFNQPAVVVDGNVARVISRLYGFETPIAKNGPQIRACASALTPQDQPRIHAEAMMDLGATVCTPQNPACDRCPLHEFCQARQQGRTAELPSKSAKPARPDRYGVVFWLQDSTGRVLTRRRPSQGLLGGMVEFPTTPWRDQPPWQAEEAQNHAPTRLVWRYLPDPVVHIFSHFRLFLTVAVGQIDTDSAPEGQWLTASELDTTALPSLMVKVRTMVETNRD